MQAQLQTLTEVAEEAGTVAVVSQPNTEFNVEVAKLQTFDRATGKILGFLTACKLFIRMRIREPVIEEQIQ